MKKILLFLLISCFHNLFAQKNDNALKEAQNQLVYQQAATTINMGQLSGNNNTNPNSPFAGFIAGSLKDIRYSGFKGSPYLFDKWQSGILLMNDGKLKELPIKYNLYDKTVEVKQGNDSIGIYPYQIKGFKINDPLNNSELVFFKVEHLKTSLGEIPTSFLLAIYNNKVGLFQHFNKKVLKADFKEPYSAGRTYDSFEYFSEYFFRKSDNTFEKIKLSERSLLNAMEDKEDELKQFMKHRKIKSEADVVDVIKYYETLKK